MANRRWRQPRGIRVIPTANQRFVDVVCNRRPDSMCKKRSRSTDDQGDVRGLRLRERGRNKPAASPPGPCSTSHEVDHQRYRLLGIPPRRPTNRVVSPIGIMVMAIAHERNVHTHAGQFPYDLLVKDGLRVWGIVAAVGSNEQDTHAHKPEVLDCLREGFASGPKSQGETPAMKAVGGRR